MANFAEEQFGSRLTEPAKLIYRRTEMAKPKLTEIIVNELIIRDRGMQDMNKWFTEINSVLFPTSIKGIALRDGVWEDCIVTARLIDDGSGRISISVLFPDLTEVKASGRKSSFLTEEYMKKLSKGKSFSTKKYDALKM